MPDVRFSPDRIFEVLLSHRVDFVVIGGVAALAHGAGWSTLDADVVVSTTDQNLVRLAAAMAELDAIYFTPDKRRIVPDVSRLRSIPGPQLIETKFGRLDVLKEAGGETYESLSLDSVLVAGDGPRVRVASLERLISMKRAANRPKDQVGIERLQAVLEATGGPSSNEDENP